MAAEGRKNRHYLGGAERKNLNPMAANDQFELDEAEVIWSNNENAPSDVKKSISGRVRKSVRDSNCIEETAGKSLPVNIPVWSKNVHKNHGGTYEDDAGEDEDYGVPPHEYLARTRGAPSSVHEGAGRTLKGRDLRKESH
ncbi:Hypothetical predicted protein [Olea europaea subsp. europaea]|uniref:Uncharacterized protein n=1 Tax=Olea europaea subsp. europaea TaxID=158383 RepID=A0A8S0RAM2_OLEEU|nr:Hypothetical predicted protein [Olea europaea subsp. europaea]